MGDGAVGAGGGDAAAWCFWDGSVDVKRWLVRLDPLLLWWVLMVVGFLRVSGG
jgi:hypothetical protein